MDAVLSLNILTGPLIVIVFGTAVAILVALLVRKPTLAWLRAAAIAVAAGIAVAAVALWLVNDVFDTFGMPLSSDVDFWVSATFASIGLALVSFWRSRWWRKAVALSGVVVFLLAGTLGVNATFGLDPTIGSLFGLTSAPTLKIAAKRQAAPHLPGAQALPLWKSWVAPAGMPRFGKIGSVSIPATLSRFHSRPAGVYLPPAALVKNPPALPVMIMMMGQPGNPDPSYVQRVLEAIADAHRGLAPIVVVADQLGDPSVDPACTNSARYGAVETFITRDVVDWVRKTFTVSKSPRDWVIAGYSNGGACALTYAAKYPQIWGNVLDISGEEFPGQEDQQYVLSRIFNGNKAAYAAQKPTTIYAHRKHTDTVGIFTVGSDDRVYVPRVEGSYEAARAAGYQATFYEVRRGGHVLGALLGGLKEGFKILYPRMGLAEAPGTPGAPPPVPPGTGLLPY